MSTEEALSSSIHTAIHSCRTILKALLDALHKRSGLVRSARKPARIQFVLYLYAAHIAPKIVPHLHRVVIGGLTCCIWPHQRDNLALFPCVFQTTRTSILILPHTSTPAHTPRTPTL